jgi:hypothetical protein
MAEHDQQTLEVEGQGEVEIAKIQHLRQKTMENFGHSSF